MAPRLKISVVTDRYVREALERCGISTPEFRAWSSEIEYLLEEDPDQHFPEVLMKEGWIRERKERRTVDGRNFRVVWEVERCAGEYHLLDLRITPMPPNLQAR